MTLRAVAYGLVALALLGGAAVLFPRTANLDSGPREVRWLVAHRPADVYERAAEAFRSDLERESGGTLTLKLVTPQELGYADGIVSHEQILRHLRDGDVDISSVYATDLGAIEPSFLALNLPFLFDDYPHVDAVFDGSVGDDVFSALAEKSDLRGLAFTLSGGFMVLVAPRGDEMHLADIAGKRIATAGGEVAAATIEALGGIPVPMENVDVPSDARDIDAIETSYARIAPILERLPDARVYESNHRLLFTAIVADAAFMDSLADTERSTLVSTARNAGRIEREDSIARGEVARAELVARGAVHEPRPYELDTMRDRFQSVSGLIEGAADLVARVRAFRD